MKRAYKVLISLFLLLLLIVIFYNSAKIITKTTGYSVADFEDILLECLNKNELTYYYNCTECENQKLNLQESSRLTRVNCLIEKDNFCQEIEKYPMWVKNDEIIYYGNNLSQIKELLEC